MAKVTMPLGSATASGSIAKMLVFAQRKGQSVVRQWLKPANPQSEDQGDVRLVLGGLGRACKGVDPTSLYIADAKLNAVGVQTWNSQIVKTIMETYMSDATAFEAEVTAYGAHAQTLVFDSSAVTLGLATFDVTYKGTTSSFAGGLMVYELAKYAIAVHASDASLFNRAPYTTALASWDADDVADFLADLQAV